jgi:polyisoprenoid-binding protein YceI
LLGSARTAEKEKGDFMRCVQIMFLAMCGVLAPSMAQTQTWQIDPMHSAAQFSVRHLGISTVRGQFEKLSGTVTYDPATPDKTSITASIDTNSINTRVEMRDNDLRSPNFLDAAKFPTIAFKSKRIDRSGSTLKVIGDLTIHGVTKEVTLDVDGPTPAIKDPMGNSRMGASASTKINRRDFGVNGAPAMAGDEVLITLDIEMIVPQSSGK